MKSDVELQLFKLNVVTLRWSGLFNQENNFCFTDSIEKVECWQHLDVYEPTLLKLDI